MDDPLALVGALVFFLYWARAVRSHAWARWLTACAGPGLVTMVATSAYRAGSLEPCDWVRDRVVRGAVVGLREQGVDIEPDGAPPAIVRSVNQAMGVDEQARVPPQLPPRTVDGAHLGQLATRSMGAGHYRTLARVMDQEKRRIEESAG
jgi:hypothetical protein